MVDVEIRVSSCGEQKMTPRLGQGDVDRRKIEWGDDLLGVPLASRTH